MIQTFSTMTCSFVVSFINESFNSFVNSTKSECKIRRRKRNKGKLAINQRIQDQNNSIIISILINIALSQWVRIGCISCNCWVKPNLGSIMIFRVVLSVLLPGFQSFMYILLINLRVTILTSIDSS